MKASRRTLAGLAFAALLPLGNPLCAQSASAYLFDLGTPFPGDPNPDGTSPWATGTITTLSDGVELTLSLAGLAGSDFISDAYFNVNPALDASGLSNLAFSIEQIAAGVTAPTITACEDAYKSDGDGFYDILLAFSKSGAGRFGAGDFVKIKITDPLAPIAASDFLFKSSTGGGEGIYYAAAHVQSVASSPYSTWIGATSYAAIPEPAGCAARLGAAALGLALATRRRARVPG